MKKLKSKDRVRRKATPANEISEHEIEQFMYAVSQFHGYPRLRELPSLLNWMEPAKINTIVRFLERAGSIIIDTEGYIIWSKRIDANDGLRLKDVASISDEAQRLFDDHDG